MTGQSKSGDKQLKDLVELRSRVLEDMEKSRNLLREIDEAISRSAPAVSAESAPASSQLPVPESGSVPSGIPRLDDLLGGGFSEGSNTLLIGPPYSSKFDIADSFVAQSVRSGYPVIIVSIDRDVGSIREDLRSRGCAVEALEESGMLKYVDAYSRSVQIEGQGNNPSVIPLDSAGNLSNFLKTMDNLCSAVRSQFGRYRMAFYSLTAWITQASDDRNFTKAFQHFSQRRKLEGATTLYLIEDGIFDKNLYENMNYFMDGSVEFRNEVSREYLRVRGLKNIRSRDWVEIIHSREGISLGSFELKRIR